MQYLQLEPRSQNLGPASNPNSTLLPQSCLTPSPAPGAPGPYTPESPEGGHRHKLLLLSGPQARLWPAVSVSSPPQLPSASNTRLRMCKMARGPPFWFSASPTLGSRIRLRLVRVLEGWRCVRALGRPRPPRSHPRRGVGANALAQGSCARPEEKSKSVPLRPGPAPTSSRQGCWARDWKREKAACKWPCARAPG